MSEYLEEGMSYSVDGDLVDNRSQLLRQTRHQLNQLRSQEMHEKDLRSKHPALQDAWEKYQSILRLVENA